MGDRDERVVVRRRTGPPYVGLRVDRDRRAEERQRLVDDVAAQVVQQAADLLRIARLAPAALRLRPPALEAGLEALHLAQLAALDQRGQGAEVVVPATVLEDREQQPALLGEGRQLARLGRRARDRLVHDHRQPGLQRGRRERDVRLVRGGDHDEVQLVGALPQLARRSGEPDVRVRGAGVRLALLVRRHHRVEDQAPGRGDQRGVEDGAGQAVADEGDPERGAGGVGAAGDMGRTRGVGGVGGHAFHLSNAVAEVQATGTMGW